MKKITATLKDHLTAEQGKPLSDDTVGLIVAIDERLSAYQESIAVILFSIDTQNLPGFNAAIEAMRILARDDDAAAGDCPPKNPDSAG